MDGFEAELRARCSKSSNLGLGEARDVLLLTLCRIRQAHVPLTRVFRTSSGGGHSAPVVLQSGMAAPQSGRGYARPGTAAEVFGGSDDPQSELLTSVMSQLAHVVFGTAHASYAVRRWPVAGLVAGERRQVGIR